MKPIGQTSFDFLAGGGEMGALMRGRDWADSGLGAPADWPLTLKTSIRLLLASQHPMLILWGRQLVMFYNDAYSPSLGPERHPGALGQPARQCWAEIWDVIEPDIDTVMRQGGSVWHEDRLIPITRHGAREDAWWTYSYSPIEDDGGVRGVLTISHDVTEEHRNRETLTQRNSSLSGDLAQQVHDWQQMHSMSSRLINSSGLSEQLLVILSTATAFLDSAQGKISVDDAATGRLITLSSQGIDEAGLGELACLPIGVGPCTKAFESRARVIIEDIESDPAYLPLIEFARRQRIRGVVASPFFDARGEPLGVLTVFSAEPCRPGLRELQLIDICAGHIGLFVERAQAERRRAEAEQALKDSETKLLQLVNTVPQLAWMANADGWIHWYNDRWYDYTGTTPQQMEGWGWQSVHDPETLPMVMERWPHSIATGEPFQMTFPLRGADGIFRPFFTLVSPLRDASGKVTQWFGTNTDVSPLQQAEQAVRKSQERLQQGLLAGGMTVWDWSPATDAIEFSSNAPAILGHASNTMATVLATVHADDAAALRAGIAAALTDGGEFRQLARMVRPDNGETVWIDMRGDCSADPTGHGPTVRGVSIDVTHRVRAEEELRQADRRKDEFLAMLAHELRNPLAPISTAAQILNKPGIGEERVRKTSEIIARQVSHMKSLVDDLLDVSRVTRGLVTLEREPLDIKLVVHSAVEQVRPLIEARRHALAVRMDSEPAFVEGDRTRLVQVVANLLNNAAKYTPQGGEIELSVQVQASRVDLSVVDNGMGIEPALLAHVFDLFAQGERTPDRSQGGLGLGLALVKSLMELHGGSVIAHSGGSGQGSRFTLSLLLLTAAPSAAAPAEAPALAAIRPLRLMLVDDNVDAAEMLAALLGAQGHHVSISHDARSALESPDAGNHNAFILDIGLPDMDGYELARRFRARPDTANAVLIALTGYGQQQDRVLSKAAGFNFHFVKPVESGDLTRVLAQIAAPP